MKTIIAGTRGKWVLLTMVMLTLLAAGIQNREAAAKQPEINKKDNIMLAEKQLYQTGATIPPIDAVVPAAFETATFGLG